MRYIAVFSIFVAVAMLPTGTAVANDTRFHSRRAAAQIAKMGIADDPAFPDPTRADYRRLPAGAFCADSFCDDDRLCIRLCFQKAAKEEAAQAAGCRRDTPAANVAARQTPEAQRVLRSTELCWQQTIKRVAEADIAKERKMAKKYGALDVDEINAQKVWIESADENIAKLREALKPLGGPLACEAPPVKDLWDCEISDPTDTSAVHEFNACQCAGRGLPDSSARTADDSRQ